VELIQNDTSLTTFNRWIQNEPAALTALCNQTNNYTVFAPVDSAFSELSNYTRTILERPEAKTERAIIIGYHIYPGYLNLTDIPEGNQLNLTSLVGFNVTAEHTNINSNDTLNGTLDFGIGTYRINGVNVVGPVKNTTNGEVVPIDLVLYPYTLVIKSEDTAVTPVPPPQPQPPQPQPSPPPPSPPPPQS
jgi:uncharacterized surface protein with fasciclin (FAS1) repeats